MQKNNDYDLRRGSLPPTKYKSFTIPRNPDPEPKTAPMHVSAPVFRGHHINNFPLPSAFQVHPKARRQTTSDRSTASAERAFTILHLPPRGEP